MAIRPKPTLKWSPTTTGKRPDNIMSSQARERNEVGFKPSYEKQKKEYMNFLMSNEYMKIWFKERAVYDKNTYTKSSTLEEESRIRRRYVQRMMTYKFPKKNDKIEEKIVKSRAFVINCPRENKHNEQNYTKIKYKPICITDKKQEGKEGQNMSSNTEENRGKKNTGKGKQQMKKGKGKISDKEKQKEDDDESSTTGGSIILCCKETK